MIECDKNKWPRCWDCGVEFNPKRLRLGYEYCLECGDGYAAKETIRKSKCVAPAFNKGAYQYVGSLEDAKLIGR